MTTAAETAGGLIGDGSGGTFYMDAAPEPGTIPDHILITDWSSMVPSDGNVAGITANVHGTTGTIVLNRTQATHLRDWLTGVLGDA